MKNLVAICAAFLLFAACSPMEIELVTPEEPTPADTVKTELNEGNDFGGNKYWLLYKVGKFELYNTEKKTVGQFKVDEAERLLRIPGTVWEIPKDAPYIFNMQTGLVFEKRLLKV